MINTTERLLRIFTAMAVTLTQKIPSVDAIFKGQANSAADEAFQIGEILLSVARKLDGDNELAVEVKRKNKHNFYIYQHISRLMIGTFERLLYSISCRHQNDVHKK